MSQYDLFGGRDERGYEDDNSIRLQTKPIEQDTAGYAYWGGVLDEAKKVAKGRDMQEIDVILPILKLAYDMLISVRDSEGNVVKVPVSSVSAYNGDYSSYSGNNLTVGVPA